MCVCVWGTWLLIIVFSTFFKDKCFTGFPHLSITTHLCVSTKTYCDSEVYQINTRKKKWQNLNVVIPIRLKRIRTFVFRKFKASVRCIELYCFVCVVTVCLSYHLPLPAANPSVFWYRFFVLPFVRAWNLISITFTNVVLCWSIDIDTNTWSALHDRNIRKCNWPNYSYPIDSLFIQNSGTTQDFNGVCVRVPISASSILFRSVLFITSHVMHKLESTATMTPSPSDNAFSIFVRTTWLFIMSDDDDGSRIMELIKLLDVTYHFSSLIYLSLTSSTMTSFEYTKQKFGKKIVSFLFYVYISISRSASRSEEQ